jgi:hypothetical protein
MKKQNYSNKITCPKCKSTFEIEEGYLNFLKTKFIKQIDKAMLELLEELKEQLKFENKVEKGL